MARRSTTATRPSLRPDLVVELDVTDDGVVVRTDDGGIWFTDGADLDQIGTLGDPGQAYDAEEHPYGTTWGFVVSANTGSRVAWLEFPQPGSLSWSSMTRGPVNSRLATTSRSPQAPMLCWSR